LTKRAGSGTVRKSYGSANPDPYVTNPEHYLNYIGAVPKTVHIQVSLIHISYVRGASKIKVKSIYKKRMATARRLIFFGVSQGVHC
jgi:hypothetical protein